MNALFLNVLNASISTSWLILAVLVLRLVLKKAPKWVHVLLWSIVALRLLLPCSIESALSLVPSAETIPVDIGMAQTPVIDSGIRAINGVVNPLLSQSSTPAPGDSANPLQLAIGILMAVWMAGAAILLAYAAASRLYLGNRVSTAIPVRDNIYQSEYVDSPFVLGIIRPKIYLPFHMDEQDLHHVIAHEQAHIRRKDHWWKPLGFLLLAVHWFNPLMWLSYTLVCRDIELACDERVIKDLANGQRADYTQALLTCSLNRRRAAVCPLAFGEVGVKERVNAVLHYKKPPWGIVAVSIAVCVIAAVCFLTNPQTTQSEHQLVYVDRFDGTALTFDRVEWVTVPSERAAELNITDDDAPSGFSVYNEAVVLEELSVSEHCVCRLLDWTDNYTQIDMTPEELAAILEERQGTPVPYHLTIERNQVTEIEEQYVP